MTTDARTAHVEAEDRPQLERRHAARGALAERAKAQQHVERPTLHRVRVGQLATHLGAEAVVEITGLRNPCAQLERLQPGLMEAVLDRDTQGQLIRKAGVMGVVLVGGEVAILVLVVFCECRGVIARVWRDLRHRRRRQ